jgi:ABC-type multidrug transport system ATPase subunit
MIRAEHISKNFGDQAVLKDISLDFEAGKTNLIIGRSGAGKTVMLKILVGLIQPHRDRSGMMRSTLQRLIKRKFGISVCKSACFSRGQRCLIQ